jgi:hypothetical protein
MGRQIYLWLYSPCGPWPLFLFLNLHTVGRTPWTGDFPVARPLPAHRTTQTESTQADTHALSGIRTHDPSVRVGEDGSCLRPRGHREGQGRQMTRLKRVAHVEINTIL